MIYTDNGAHLSPGGKYRYLLWREWRRVPRTKGGTALFIMLNPSTANAKLDDPTIRRCVGFTERLGYNRLEVANLFAYRSPDPLSLRRDTTQPIGKLNDRILINAANRAHVIICAWGKHGSFLGRDHYITNTLLKDHDLYALKLLEDGTPGHPLYLPNDSKLVRLN